MFTLSKSSDLSLFVFLSKLQAFFINTPPLTFYHFCNHIHELDNLYHLLWCKQLYYNYRNPWNKLYDYNERVMGSRVGYVHWLVTCSYSLYVGQKYYILWLGNGYGKLAWIYVTVCFCIIFVKGGSLRRHTYCWLPFETPFWSEITQNVALFAYKIWKCIYSNSIYP